MRPLLSWACGQCSVSAAARRECRIEPAYMKTARKARSAPPAPRPPPPATILAMTNGEEKDDVRE
jgi:hypothetical protein